MSGVYAELYSDTHDFDELDEPDREYPILVTVSTTHVVWIEADSPAAAERCANDDGHIYEDLNSQNSAGGELIAKAPDEFDVRCGADTTLHADGPRDWGHANEYGPWRPGEPQSYRWRTWGKDQAAFVERDMAEALAKFEAKAAAR